MLEKVIFVDGFLIRNYLYVDFVCGEERVDDVKCDGFVFLCLFVKLVVSRVCVLIFVV